MVSIMTEEAASVDEGAAIATSASVSRGGAGNGFSALPVGAARVPLVFAVMLAASPLTLDRTTVTLTDIVALRDCADRFPAESRNSAGTASRKPQRMRWE